MNLMRILDDIIKVFKDKLELVFNHLHKCHRLSKKRTLKKRLNALQKTRRCKITQKKYLQCATRLASVKRFFIIVRHSSH